MSDTLMTIIGIFIAVILMFILPLIIVANKHDQISQTVTQMAVSDFVDTVTKQGEITEFDYNKLIQKLYATGNSYDIEIEAQIIDDNPRRATTTLSSALTGEYKYYSVHTNTILDKIREDGKYELKKDDYITVTAKNSNVTVATILKNMFYKLTGKDTHTIGASAAQLVLNKSDAKNSDIATNPITIHAGEKTVTVKTKRYTKEEQTIAGKLDIVVVLDCETTTMPCHNKTAANGVTSEDFMRNIINAVGSKGTLEFILTSNPKHIYTDLSDVSWIYEASINENSINYLESMSTAINRIKNRSGVRCVVFLSWNADKESRLNAAVSYVAAHSSDYDLFCTTPCCANKPQGKLWEKNLPAEKWGKNLVGNDIGDRFASLVNRKVLIETLVPLPDSQTDSTDLKIKLVDYNAKYNLTITVNSQIYVVGETMPSYVIYNDAGTYVLDLKLVKEILNMNDDDWQNATITVDYVQG